MQMDCFNAQGQRMVAGCIPYRKEKKGGTIEILMVRSQSGNHIVFPKGGCEEHESAEEAASREAQEEAGVQGHVRNELGVWTFYKAKRQLGINPKGACEVRMFLFEVTQELDTWPEQHRGREWIDLRNIEETILERCHHEWMHNALGKLIQQWTNNPIIAEVSPPDDRQQQQQRHNVLCRL